MFSKLLLKYITFLAVILIAGCSAPYVRFASDDSGKEIKEERTEDNIVYETRIESVGSSEQNPAIDHKKMMNVINKWIGVPYKYGGKDESGFDCSGFTSYVYDKTFGIRVPPYSVDQYKMGRSVNDEEMKFGDLVFFNTTGRIPSHVGIYVGSQRFAHSSTQKGVVISSLNSNYYKRRFLGARRLINQ